MRLTVRSLLPLACLLALMFVVPAAQASDASVRAAIESSNKQVKESPEIQGALKEVKDSPKTIAKLQKGVAALVKALHIVVSKVDAQHASTSKGKEGEADYLTGLHRLSKGFEYLDAGLTDIKDRRKTAAKTDLKKALAAIKEGGIIGKEGDTLLGVKGK